MSLLFPLVNKIGKMEGLVRIDNNYKTLKFLKDDWQGLVMTENGWQKVRIFFFFKRSGNKWEKW